MHMDQICCNFLLIKNPETMKQLLIVTWSLFLICSFSNAQNTIVPESHKVLDSIVEYDYNVFGDSIKRSKIEYTNYNGGIHKLIENFRWLEAGQKWIHDYALLHNKIDLYYDESGNMLREIKYLWNSSDSSYAKLSETHWDINIDGELTYEEQEIWNIEGKTIRGYYKNFEYDSLGYLIFENKCEWTISIINWWGKYQHEYAYDSGGNRISHSEHGWNPDLREWQPDLKEEWDYQSSRSQVFYINYIWDSNINNWVNKGKWTRSINSNPGWVQEICHIWLPVDSIWIEDRKKERVYDDSGIWTSEKTYNWSVAKNDWEKAAWQERGLDNNNYLVLDIIYIWDSSNNDWAGYDKKEMDYDASGNQILLITYDWSSQDFKWLKDSKTERYFDLSQNKASEEFYKWNTVNARWTGIDKSAWEFDTDSDLVVYSDFDWKIESEIWNLETKSFYYYQSSSSDPSLFVKNDILIYPNPNSGIINISGLSQPAEIKVFSIQGILLKTFTQVENRIDVSELPVGIYIMNLENEEIRVVKRIVVEK